MYLDKKSKEVAISEGYRDLALALLKDGVKTEGEDFYYSETGQLWRSIFITFDEGVRNDRIDSHLARMEKPNIDEDEFE